MNKRKILIVAFFILALLIIGCTGDDKLEKDKIPPTKPNLIPHRGDTGDGEYITSAGNKIILNDLNNGIDAESSFEGFRIIWDPLIYDNDLEKIIVHRYMNDDIEQIVKVDSMSADYDYYHDTSVSSDFVHENKFSYFIDVYDRAGNSTRSDTVHYKLTDKAILETPQNGIFLPTSNNLEFNWQYLNNFDYYRVLLFNESNDFIWMKDIDADVGGEDHDDTTTTYTGMKLADGIYHWRVDVFKYDFELGFYYGSESRINQFAIDSNKNLK